jgi:hypothetical protein
MLAFYGGLDAGQRAAALQGTLRIGDLSRAQFEALEEWTRAGLSLQYKSASGEPLSADDGIRFSYLGISQDPTESFPTGFPQDGLICLTIGESDYVEGPLHSAGVQTTTLITPWEVAWGMYALPRANSPPFIRRFLPSTYTQWRAIQSTVFKLTFQFTRNIWASAQVACTNPVKGPPVTYDKLPAGFRRRVAQELARGKRGYLDSGAAKNSTLTPP